MASDPPHAANSRRPARGVHGLARGLKIAAAITAPALLGGCNVGVLDPKGPVGGAERQILLNALGVMLVIVVPTLVATILFAWWYRASNRRARRRPDFVYSGAIELIVWSIPTLVIIFLGGIIWVGAHDLDPAKPLSGAGKPLEVQVVSLDWKWLFIYPDDGVASVNELVAPVGTPIHLTLTSGSVMNAFFIPRAGSMIYTMYGMATNLNLQLDEKGSYEGLSTMFSGDGFPGMHFTARIVAPAEFQAWIAKARASDHALDRDAYLQLARQSSNVPPTTYRDVDPRLFHELLMKELPAAPGPDDGKGWRGASIPPGSP